MVVWLAGLRGRVTVTVLAVTAVVFSALATIGFIRIADGGRAAIRERTAGVADELVASIEAGAPATGLTTADGVRASVVPAGASAPARDGEVVVVRRARGVGGEMLVVARSAEAPLTDSLRSLYRVLWIGVPTAAVVSAVLAGAATRRALRPVDDITTLAASIGPDPAGMRVPEPGSADEIDRLARTVNGMLDRIEAGRTAQRRFTSDAAHELRTPLTAIQGELDLVAAGVEVADGATIARMQAQCRRLGDRIDDLVLLATMDEGRAIGRGPVDLGALVETEVRAVASAAEVLIPGSVVVVGDDALLARAVRNLVANGARHAKATVAVTVELDKAGRAWVHVDDDGPGIPPESRQHVLTRFGRLDEARSAGAGGAGLGLAIVASLAAAHGGGVEVGDAPIGGARVSLWVPANGDATEPSDRDPQRPRIIRDAATAGPASATK